jgi:hypothetical protein
LLNVKLSPFSPFPTFPSASREARTHHDRRREGRHPARTRKGGRHPELWLPALLLWEGGSRPTELDGVWRRGEGKGGGGGAMPHLARCPSISPRPAAAGHAGELSVDLPLRKLSPPPAPPQVRPVATAVASSARGSLWTAAPGAHPLRALSRARGPPQALQVSFAVGVGSAAGPASEVYHGDPIARLISIKPALSETQLVCVSHYAARTIPFALPKHGYPLICATKHQ